MYSSKEMSLCWCDVSTVIEKMGYIQGDLRVIYLLLLLCSLLRSHGRVCEVFWLGVKTEIWL